MAAGHVSENALYTSTTFKFQISHIPKTRSFPLFTKREGDVRDKTGMT